MNPASSCSSWSWDEDKEFESAVADIPEEAPNRWELVASRVPGRTPAEVEQHHQLLVEDINAIEAGLVPLPRYDDDDDDQDDDVEDEDDVPVLSKRKRGREGERRKGTPWTEEEHKLFLIGLQKYGKGDWRSISRNAVVTRTPTQVASHAQKYFERKTSGKKEKKRSSIHDVTVNEADILRASNQIVQVNSPSSQQQTMNHSQVSFPNHGGAALGYQNYGYPM